MTENKDPESRLGAVPTTFLMSLTRRDKERLTEAAETHGLSLSAFLRLAAYEYIDTHNW